MDSTLSLREQKNEKNIKTISTSHISDWCKKNLVCMNTPKVPDVFNDVFSQCSVLLICTSSKDEQFHHSYTKVQLFGRMKLQLNVVQASCNRSHGHWQKLKRATSTGQRKAHVFTRKGTTDNTNRRTQVSFSPLCSKMIVGKERHPHPPPPPRRVTKHDESQGPGVTARTISK